MSDLMDLSEDEELKNESVKDFEEEKKYSNYLDLLAKFINLNRKEEKTSE